MLATPLVHLGHAAKKKSIFSRLLCNGEQFWATVWNSDDIAGQLAVGLKPRDCADCVYRPALPSSRPGTQPVGYTFGLWVGDGRARIFFHQSLDLGGSGQAKVKSVGKNTQTKPRSRPFSSV